MSEYRIPNRVWALAPVVSLYLSLSACIADPQYEPQSDAPYDAEPDASLALDSSPQVTSTTQSLADGVPFSAKPAIGQVQLPLGKCTAALISPIHAITAAHCNFHSDTLSGPGSFTVGGTTVAVTDIYLFGPEVPAGDGVPSGNDDFNSDVALLLLDPANPVQGVAPLAIAAAAPSPGQQVSTYGNGQRSIAFWFGNWRCVPGTEGQTTTREFQFGDYTLYLCPGDSGGPATYGSSTSNGAIWGVNSYAPANIGDVWGNVSRYKEDIMSVIRMWDHGNFYGVHGIETGFRRTGVSLASYSNSDDLNCQWLCNTDSRCNSYSFRKSTEVCTLLKSAGDWTPDPDYASGLSRTNRFEYGVDRNGHDYRSFSTSSVSACSDACSDERRCAAFSWVDSSDRCYLKEYLGFPQSNSKVTSGTKRGFEYYSDRNGTHIAGFSIWPGDVRVCQEQCEANSACDAYTYVNPVYSPTQPFPTLQTEALCWLKSTVGSRLTNVSGNKRLISGLRRSTP